MPGWHHRGIRSVSTPVQLNQSASVTLNGSGNGTVQLGPISARETWQPATVHVSVSTNTNEAQCSIYAGNSVSPNTFRDATFSGSTGDSTDRVSADTITCGWYIWAVWTGGDPGARATVNVTGTNNV
jgi:hypothetical protein